jgi:hypothetical protein
LTPGCPHDFVATNNSNIIENIPRISRDITGEKERVIMKHGHIVSMALVALLCGVPALGQITITSSDFPSTIGYQYTLTSSDDVVTVNPGPSGANQTWDLRGIVATVTVELEVIDRSETPNPSWIPDANLITRTTEDLQTQAYTYNQLNTNFARILGMAFTTPDSSWVIEWTNEPPSFVFPIQYGDDWFSAITWEESMQGMTISYSDSSWYTADGWGTVHVDGMDPLPCLRIKEHEHMVASVMGFPMIDEWYWSYSWMAPGHPDVASMQSEAGGNENFTTGHFTRMGGGAGAEPSVEILPTAFGLESAYPNPFNPETTIPYSVDQLMDVELVIYNALGQKVRTLVSECMLPGSYSVVWNGTDRFGNPVGSGVYYCRLLGSHGKTSAQRLMLVR